VRNAGVDRDKLAADFDKRDNFQTRNEIDRIERTVNAAVSLLE